MFQTIPSDISYQDQTRTDDIKFVLVSDVVFLLDFKKEIYSILIPEGFSTDFASIPKCVRNIIENVGKYNDQFLLHDWMYSKKSDLKFTRKEVDQIMLEKLKEYGMNLVKRNVIYNAVRIFGGSHWKT